MSAEKPEALDTTPGNTKCCKLQLLFAQRVQHSIITIQACNFTPADGLQTMENDYTEAYKGTLQNRPILRTTQITISRLILF